MSKKNKSEPVSQHDECNALKRVNREFESLLDLNIQLADLHELDKIIDAAAQAISSRLKKEEGMICLLNSDENRISGSFWLAGKAPELFSTRLDKDGNPIDDEEIDRLGNGLKGFIKGLYENFSGSGIYKGGRYRQYFVLPFRYDGKTCGEIVVLETDDTYAAYGGEEIPKIYDYLSAILKGAFTRVRLAEQMVETEVIARKSTAEKEKREQEIIRAQKLESLGLLAGGIAHDFNNILTAISGNVSLAKMYLKPEEKAFQKLTKAEKASFQAKELTRQLLTFSRKGGAPTKKVISIRDLIEDSVQFTLRGANVCCDCVVPQDLYKVEVDEGQIGQVINNLLINADQAMPEGGTVHVKAENINIGTNNNQHLKPGKYVKISVKDHGIGIPEANLIKIFDPYFTTKEEGNGLGLSTAYSIVKKHGGGIDVESNEGRGSVFHVYLPASKETKEEKKKVEKKSPFFGKEKILVMDDEEEIRNVLGEMLESIGYKVDFARDGMEAIESIRSAKESRNPFDAVILDLTVPGAMGGKEAIQKLREIAPELKAIVSSGYVNDPVMVDYKRYGFSDVIAKPFEISRLSKVLHEALTEQGGLN